MSLTNDEALYFLHIPKTAGMTFTDFVKSQFAPSKSNTKSNLKDFVKTPPEEIAEFKFIAGHFGYHVDALVKRKLIYITMLRDPVERTISHYAHLRRNPDDPAYAIVKSQSLLEFVRDPRAQGLYANLQTRSIADDTDFFEFAAHIETSPYDSNDAAWRQLTSYAPNQPLDSVLLERALQRLSAFAFVGITEHFDESLELLSHTFGWPSPAASKIINAATNRPPEHELSQKVIDLIRENNKADSVLYEAGKKLFIERYNHMAQSLPGKALLSADLDADTIAALQRKIEFQRKTIKQLGEELQTIQNSFGWRFVLRINALRQKLIPKGSKREAFYLKLRGH